MVLGGVGGGGHVLCSAVGAGIAIAWYRVCRAGWGWLWAASYGRGAWCEGVVDGGFSRLGFGLCHGSVEVVSPRGIAAGEELF